MGEVRNYRDLDVWKFSRKLVSDVYKITQSFPKEEIYALTSQLRRAAVSILSNIAEGHARSGPKEFMQFLSIALGSLAEVETQLLLSEDLHYTTAKDTVLVLQEIERLQKMLHALRTVLRSKLHPPLPIPQPPITHA